MPLNIAGKNAILSSGMSEIDRVSLHTGSPGTLGTENEVSGAPYDRQAIIWGTPANGQIKPVGNIIFDIPVGNITITTIGLWMGTTFAGTLDNLDPASQPFTNGGQYVMTDTSYSLV